MGWESLSYSKDRQATDILLTCGLGDKIKAPEETVRCGYTSTSFSEVALFRYQCASEQQS